MPLFALLLLFFMPTIAVRSKHAKTTEDSFDLEETVNTAYETLSPYTRPPDDDPHVKHLKERGIEWEEPTKDNIRKKLIAEMAADRSRAEAEAARQHDSDDDEEDEVEKEAEDEQEEVDVSMPASVQHAKLVTLRRPSDDRPLAWDFKMRGIEWVDPTPENDRIAFADATVFSAIFPDAAPQVLVHHVSTTTSESSLHAYAYYTIATALIVVAACWYCGIVVETLKEMSRRVYQSTDIFNRIRNAQLADALHGKVVECDQLRDANGVLSEALAAMQERLRSAEENIVELEESKQQASLREVALNSELQNRHSVVEGFAQNERLLQEHYAQSREISRRKEAALKERLDEQCLICESLNDAVEEMQRLITTIIEANDAIATERLQMVVPDTAPERNVATEARQLASLPDIPVDPITNTVQTEAVAPDRDAIQRFVNSVYSTLFSLPHGYDSLAMLLRDLSEDSGLNGEAVARELGYDSFEAFLQSPEMAPRILVGTLPNGRRLYKVYPTKVDLERYVTQQLGTDYGDTK
ncbi:hypothetical protein AAVH_25422 [Aphelenchoides avenae]|nr:hypothetical protein AAVH_25422 [Aphelenchus avenae]